MNSSFSLKYIIDNWFAFLFKDGEFIKESITHTYREDSVYIVSSAKLKLKFINERCQKFLDIASIHRPTEFEDIHWVKYILTGEGYEEGLLNEIDAYFFKQHKTQIEDLFSKEKVDDTLRKIEELSKKRAEEKWGPTLDDLG